MSNLRPTKNQLLFKKLSEEFFPFSKPLKELSALQIPSSDQWLDVIAFDLEPVVGALTTAIEGGQTSVFNAWKDATTFLTVVNGQLAKNTYLVGGSISIADISLYVNVSVLFQHAFDAKLRGTFPNVGKWFEIVAKEIGNALPAVTLAEKTHENLACSRKEKAPKAEKAEKA